MVHPADFTRFLFAGQPVVPDARLGGIVPRARGVASSREAVRSAKQRRARARGREARRLAARTRRAETPVRVLGVARHGLWLWCLVAPATAGTVLFGESDAVSGPAADLGARAMHAGLTLLTMALWLQALLHRTIVTTAGLEQRSWLGRTQRVRYDEVEAVVVAYNGLEIRLHYAAGARHLTLRSNECRLSMARDVLEAYLDPDVPVEHVR